MELSITLIIIIVTTLVSISGFSSHRIVDDLIFYPPAVSQQKQWWRFFTCGVIHGNWGHLIFNMYALYLFGAGRQKTQFGYINTGVEYKFIEIFGDPVKGRIIYLVMYILALAVCLIPTYAKHRNDYHYRSLGASGAVSAVIFASILIYPTFGMGLIFLPIFIAGFLFGILYLLISSWLDRKGADNVNHSAHIFGAIFGIVFLTIACKLFSNYPILENFVTQIKNMSLHDIIQLGSF